MPVSACVQRCSGRLDTVPLVAVVVFATCLLILWVFLHLRQEARELPTTK